ncbi:nitroreductase family protein [Afifella marina]|nr:nitroreductase [Afifella marina]
MMETVRRKGKMTQATMHDLLDHLRKRRSTPSVQLGDPGPDPDTLSDILTIGARVPDHGKLAPWRYIIYSREDRQRLAETLKVLVLKSGDPEAERKAGKATQFAIAPLVIGVVSTAAAHAKVPVWEQELTAGAVCMNLLHAAAGHGFAAQWLTQWFAFDPAALRALGVGENEKLAGFIHIGTASLDTPERDRPDISALTTFFSN